MDTSVGRRPDQLRVYLVRSSRQTLAVEWLDDTGVPMNLQIGSVVTLEVTREDGTSVASWTGTTDQAMTTWSLTAAQTTLDNGSYRGRVVINDGNAAGPLVALTALLTVQ